MAKLIEQYLNKVIQGDCLEVMKNIPSKSIDMILCDLPYGTTPANGGTGKQRLVFAPAKYVDDHTLLDYRIDFCQLPYEIYRIQK